MSLGPLLMGGAVAILVVLAVLAGVVGIIVAAVAGRRGAGALGLLGGGSIGFLGIVAAIMSRTIAVMTFGGESKAFEVVMLHDMNAVANRTMIVAGVGLGIALVGAVVAGGSLILVIWPRREERS
ncbi:MAG: hypothetical protein WC538_21160 [Thermoanaerobaculia bacterium]|jgi:hypothetical protein